MGYLKGLIKYVHIFKIMAARFFTVGDGNHNMEREKTRMFGTGIRVSSMNLWF